MIINHQARESMKKNKIKLEMTEFQLSCFISVINTCSSIMEEDEITDKEIMVIDKALLENGYER